MIRLAFVIHFNKTWIGGINVIINLINSLLNLKEKRLKIKIILFTNSKKKINKLNLSKFVEVIETQEFFNRNIFYKIIDKISIIFFGKTFFLEKILISNKINFLSHTSIITGKKSFTKSIVWIPDFQYLYFLNFFSLKYKFLKKINTILIKKHAYKVLLSSNSTKKDFKKICNIQNNKILVNKFVFNVPKLKYLRKKSYLKSKYSLKDNFFYLPNQYWYHKNHKVVINALNYLKNKKKTNVFIYSSGSKNDYRFPHNFKSLMELVKKYNLDKNYFYLGIVPYIDVMSLIFHSTAVINPSLFEGWSSTVEQAKAYKKKIILSNIRVHKEQKPRFAYYFRPENFIDLSKILMKLKLFKNSKNINFYEDDMDKKMENYIKEYYKILK